MPKKFSLIQEESFNPDQKITKGLSKKKRLKLIFGVRSVKPSDGKKNCSTCNAKIYRNSGSYSGIKCLLMIKAGETGMSCPDLSDKKICNRFVHERKSKFNLMENE